MGHSSSSVLKPSLKSALERQRRTKERQSKKRKCEHELFNKTDCSNLGMEIITEECESEKETLMLMKVYVKLKKHDHQRPLQSVFRLILKIHCYADDSQLYLSFFPNDNANQEATLARVERCIEDI